jgi:hypothetical protein
MKNSNEERETQGDLLAPPSLMIRDNLVHFGKGQLRMEIDTGVPWGQLSGSNQRSGGRNTS